MGKARLNNSILWEAMSIAGHNVSLLAMGSIRIHCDVQSLRSDTSILVWIRVNAAC